MTLKIKKIRIFIFIFIIFSNLNVFAEEDAEITNFIITNTRYDLILFFNIENVFNENIREAIESGVPTSFSFFVKLYRSRTIWFDEEIIETELTHTIKYNDLKKEFIIYRSWENKTYTTKTFDDAKKLMTEIDGLNVVHMSNLEKGEDYEIQVKAELSMLKLPLYLHHILFFLKLWDFETDWYSFEFQY